MNNFQWLQQQQQNITCKKKNQKFHIFYILFKAWQFDHVKIPAWRNSTDIAVKWHNHSTVFIQDPVRLTRNCSVNKRVSSVSLKKKKPKKKKKKKTSFSHLFVQMSNALRKFWYYPYFAYTVIFSWTLVTIKIIFSVLYMIHF